MSDEFGKELCALVGIDPGIVQSTSIVVNAGEYPTMTFNIIVHPSLRDKIISALQKYEIREPTTEANYTHDL